MRQRRGWAVVALDVDVPTTLTWTIESGDAAGAFAIDANGQITVADGSLLDHRKRAG